MQTKTIALIVLDAREAEWLVAQACELAGTLEAHLTVLHAYMPIVFYDGLESDSMIFATMREWEERESLQIRRMVNKEVLGAGVRAEYRAHQELHGGVAFMLSSARSADLVVVGTNGSQTRSPDDRNLLERLIRNLGRPVLVLGPSTRFTGPVERAMIGWSDTREATRAAHDALGLVRPGGSIELMSVVAHLGDPPLVNSKVDFAVALDRLGFRTSLAERRGDSGHRAETLVAAARACDAQLLVAGAFGHSMFHDFIIGAVTRDLLASAALPILLSK